jgi:hypothetical protein
MEPVLINISMTSLRESGALPAVGGLRALNDGKLSAPFKGATSEKTQMNSEFYWAG